MALRWIFFLCAQLAGGLALLLLGRWWAPLDSAWFYALAGALLGAWVWWLLDAARGLRFLRWLRESNPLLDSVTASPWYEVALQVERLRRQHGRALLDSQAQLQEFLSAIQASPNGVILLDAQGRIEWVNQTASGHLGLDPQRDAGQLIGNLLRDPGFAAYQAQGQFERELHITGPGSTPTHIKKLSVQLHPYGTGRRLLLTRDITQLEQAEAIRRDFVANVSHEIRTPLTVLSGFVETLQSLPLSDAERTQYLDLMAQQTRRMQSLVNDLLTLSRLEGSPLPSMNERVPVPELLHFCETEARTLSSVLNAGLGHRLEFDVGAADKLALRGNRSELQSALSNLVGNAVRYTPAGGSIRVSCCVLPAGRGDGDLEFVVSDSGPGIAPEHIPRLTERFYRVDRSRSRETGGTGLGLAIVKHVAQRHGAQLRIESQPGRGASFAIRFPAARLSLERQAEAAQAA